MIIMSKEKKSNRELRVRLTPKMWEMFDFIKEYEGFEHDTETTRNLIRSKYKEIIKESRQD